MCCCYQLMVDLDGCLQWLGLTTYTSAKIHEVPSPSIMLTLQVWQQAESYIIFHFIFNNNFQLHQLVESLLSTVLIHILTSEIAINKI